MWFFVGQVWFWIIVSFVLGWLAHWLYATKDDQSRSMSDTTANEPTLSDEPSTELKDETSNPIPEVSDSKSTDVSAEVDEAWQPERHQSQPENVDDLKKIKGIGPVNEKALNDLGIYTYAQIAAWSLNNIRWVEGSLAFPGRVSRENWVGQAKTLMNQ